MIIVRGVLSILLIWFQLGNHLCEEDCTNKNNYACEVDIINMTSDGGVKLLRLIDNESNVHIQKLIVAISASGVFLKKISHAIAYLTYVNYREPTFNLPEGNTISEIEIMRATGLRAFIAGPNAQLERLIIQHCSMDRLPQTIPKMTMLKILYLTNCMLSVLRLDMFVENQNLAELDLSSNQIRQIFPVTGQPGRALSIEILTLTGNQLEHLDMSVFASMLKITRIQFFENRLTHLKASVPVNLPLLNTLYFMNNLIEVFDLRNLTLPSLSSLILSSNALKQMPTLPKKLPELNYLALSENNLTYLDLSYFRPYRKLRDIYLALNQISTVRSSSPVTLPVTWLDLEENRITVFDITGCSLPNITVLNLEKNSLTMVPPVFKRFPNICLYLDKNPIPCDALLPYKDKIQNERLYKDRVSSSRACDTTSSLLIGEKIKICCNS